MPAIAAEPLPRRHTAFASRGCWPLSQLQQTRPAGCIYVEEFKAHACRRNQTGGSRVRWCWGRWRTCTCKSTGCTPCHAARHFLARHATGSPSCTSPSSSARMSTHTFDATKSNSDRRMFPIPFIKLHESCDSNQDIMAAKSTSFGSPYVRCTYTRCTCGQLNGIKKLQHTRFDVCLPLLLLFDVCLPFLC